MTDELDGSADDRGLSRIFSALANADRIAIIDMLRGCATDELDGVSISRVAEATGLTRFAASRHLRILCDAGLVSATRKRHSTLHRIDVRGFYELEDWLSGTSRGDHWLDTLAALDRPA